MTVIAFDTLAFATKLKDAGLDEKIAFVQAEATANILNDLATNQLATKQDLVSLEMKMYAFIVKATSFTVGILGGLQILFHFVK